MTKQPKINVTNNFGETQVFYYIPSEGATQAEVYKNNMDRWEVMFEGKKRTGSWTKAQAVSYAKDLLKKEWAGRPAGAK